MPRPSKDPAQTLAILAEVFREYGYEGTSIGLITQATGLGKGSLYNLFPGGKAEMMTTVLTDIKTWFETHIYAPLQAEPHTPTSIQSMLDAVTRYFHSGQRVCLMGVLATGHQRDQFSETIAHYFTTWIETLTASLERIHLPHHDARHLAEETVLQIQGAIILSRALNDPAIFQRTITQLHNKLTPPAPKAK
ncbi:TetR/AcrR family transcriptional regulator [Neokomagataea thailandica]|uniref:Transcriptional regulator n=1 Tax=Neokomagataea tanensis NBRC 106556 TaxID=1223519 RepID=A0ABQ0QIW8_9PROT|nr:MULTISPECIES: TetR/AcrR family transcriptional regulator [Neokomagataea]GBR46448.1 transcriptional regulator [Neokomagataea tanensis NBRC 106556]